MKIRKKKVFLKKSLAIIFVLIFICQLFISFSNLGYSNLNFENFGFGHNPSPKTDSNLETIELENEIPQEGEMEWNYDYSADSDVQLLDFDGEMINLEVIISDLEIKDIIAPTGDIYQQLSIEEGGYLGEVGRPKLPFKTVKILLPYGKDLGDIEVVTEQEQVLEGIYKIEPAQSSFPLGSTEIPEFSLNKSVYNSADPYPEEFFSVVGVFNSRGYRILILNLYPVYYIPKNGEISYFKNMKVKINLMDSPEANSLFRGIKKDEDHVVELVDTPQLIVTYSSGSLLLQSSGDVMGDLGPYDYVIITNEFLRDSNGAYTFQDLAAAKNASGIQTTIVTVEDIYESYSGIDKQTKIRNFIIDAYQNWGIEYVLLGGDGDGEVNTNLYLPEQPPYNIEDVGGEFGDSIIPVRLFIVPGVIDYEPVCTDLYYAGLDGTWNDDGDLFYGELSGDNFDLLAEVYVGRAPVDSEEELSNFVMKTLAHEAALASNDPYLNNTLMVGEDLGWGGIAKWGGNFMDDIINGSDLYGYITAGFPEGYNVETLYERDTDWNKTDLISKINDGVHIINHLGHANNTRLMKFYINDTHNDVDLLENDKYYFGYSQGCFAGSFDNLNLISENPPTWFNSHDCIVEHLVTSEHGAFAFIANSRYGWGVAYSTDGASQHYHREFIDAIFGEGIEEIGKAYQDSKEDSIGFLDQYDMVFCYYVANLLGDPTTKLHEFYKEIVYEPIFINGTAKGVGAHNWTWAEQQAWCSGSGTLYDPYIIEDATIEDYDFGNCIEIINSNKYFIIKDCTFYNSSAGSTGAGIKLVNITNAQIINNNCSINNHWGIYLENSYNNILSGNIANDNNFCGIFLCHYSDNNTLSNNTANDNDLYGICVWNSFNNNLSRNTVNYNKRYGIHIITSGNNYISGNTANNNWFGIAISGNNNYISGNTANNSEDCGMGIGGNNIYISGNTAYNNSYGMTIGGNNNYISGNTANINWYGLSITGNNNLITGNTANNNTYGINLNRGDYNTISGNTINNNKFGMDIAFTNNNHISGNGLNNNDYGIYLKRANDYATISENSINNNDYGIYLFFYKYYSIIYYNNYTTISGNTIIGNNYGIYLDRYNDNNTISANTIKANNYGILIISSSNNIIYHNNIIDNLVQASDNNPAANNWYHPDLLEGNYWADYPGVDDGSGEGKHAIAGDDIGDTNIPWPSSGYDYYPLVNSYSWSLDIRLTNAMGDSWMFCSAVDSHNKIHICWADERDGNLEVYYNCFDGVNWMGEKRLTNNSGASIPTSIAIGPDNKVHIVWQNHYYGEHYMNYDIYYKSFNGTEWSVEQQLTFSKRAHDALIAVDRDNKIHVVWADGRDDPIFPYCTEMYYKSFDENGWSEDYRITESPRDSYVPSLAIDQNGTLHLIFSDNRDDNWKIYYSSYNGTDWTDEINITGPSENLIRGNIVIGSDNIAHFLWANEIIENQFELYYRYYDINKDIWSNQELIPIDELIVAIDYPPILLQSIIISQDNSLYIAWSDSINGNPEIFYIYKDQNGWSLEKQLTIAPGQSILPNIIITHENKIFIFWSDFRDGNFEIYYKFSELVLINTPIGTDVDVTDPITDITLIFENVTSCGYTNITLLDTGPAPPKGFRLTPSNVYYDITTTANYTGTIIIAIPYNESQVIGKESNLKLKHWNPESGKWEHVTTGVNTDENIIYGVVTTLSIFAVMEQIVLIELENLKQKVINSPDSGWRKPAENRKNTIIEKIDEVIGLYQDEEYDECYDKILYDIKPKLTGLKVDEEGNIFGNGVFKNPWVIDPDFQQEFREIIDSILNILKSLAS